MGLEQRADCAGWRGRETESTARCRRQSPDPKPHAVHHGRSIRQGAPQGASQNAKSLCMCDWLQNIPQCAA
ncbi:hypothetical protein M3J09_009688 [Ascochyta lentis]